MLLIICIIPTIALIFLLIGFLEIKFPFITLASNYKFAKKINMQVARKVVRRRQQYSQLHIGFINIYNTHHKPAMQRA